MTTNFCGAVKMAEFFIREYITCAANLFDRDFASSFKNGCHLAAVIDGWYRSRDGRRRWNFFFIQSISGYLESQGEKEENVDRHQVKRLLES